MNEENKNTEVTEETTEVKVVDKKSGILDKIKEHKKAVIIGAGVVGAIAVAKIAKAFGNRSNQEDYVDEFDDDDLDVIDADEIQD